MIQNSWTVEKYFLLHYVFRDSVPFGIHDYNNLASILFYMNNDGEIQNLFFESIRQRLPGHISLADELAEVLGISNDSAYRRLRGDKKLSVEEMRVLSRKYLVSIDSLFGQSNADVIRRMAQTPDTGSSEGKGIHGE